MSSSHLFTSLMRLLICNFMKKGLISYVVFVSVWSWDIIMGVYIILFVFDPNIWFRIYLFDIIQILFVGYESKILSIFLFSMLLDMNSNYICLYLLYMNSNSLWLCLLEMNPKFVNIFSFISHFLMVLCLLLSLFIDFSFLDKFYVDFYFSFFDGLVLCLFFFFLFFPYSFSFVLLYFFFEHMPFLFLSSLTMSLCFGLFLWMIQIISMQILIFDTSIKQYKTRLFAKRFFQ